MSSTAPAPRIVSVCVSGATAEHASQNVGRLQLIRAVAEEVNAHWENLDAVIFPGVFLRSAGTVGSLAFTGRVEVLDRSDLVDPLIEAASVLSKSPDALIVSGIGGPVYPNGSAGDQLCVAWNGEGVAGIGRKIFPVSAEADRFVCFESDFLAKERVVPLPSGRTAILCTCYDMFGVAERPGRHGVQDRAIRRISSQGDETGRASRGVFQTLKERCLADWNDLLINSGASVGLAAIHGFGRNSTAYWQKHGIATCAASLPGFAVGAAHFNSNLPASAVRSPLAARDVPASHLTAGSSRAAHSWSPVDAFYFGGKEALARLYA